MYLCVCIYIYVKCFPIFLWSDSGTDPAAQKPGSCGGRRESPLRSSWWQQSDLWPRRDAWQMMKGTAKDVLPKRGSEWIGPFKDHWFSCFSWFFVFHGFSHDFFLVCSHDFFLLIFMVYLFGNGNGNGTSVTSVTMIDQRSSGSPNRNSGEKLWQYRPDMPVPWLAEVATWAMWGVGPKSTRYRRAWFIS